MSSTFQCIHVVVPFSMNKRAANVGSQFDINYFTVRTTSFCSCRLAFKKTLTFSSSISLNHERTLHKFWLCTFHWRGWKILKKFLPHSIDTVFGFFFKIMSYIVNCASVVQLSCFFFFTMEWSTLMHFSTSFSLDWYSTLFANATTNQYLYLILIRNYLKRN